MMRRLYLLFAVALSASLTSCSGSSFDDIFRTEQPQEVGVFDRNGYPIYDQGVILDRDNRTNRQTRSRDVNGNRNRSYDGCPGDGPRTTPRRNRRDIPRTQTPRPRPQPQSTPRPRPQPKALVSSPQPRQLSGTRPAPSKTSISNVRTNPDN